MEYANLLTECLQSPFNIGNYRKFIVNFLNGTTLREISGMRSAELFAEYSFYVEGFALVGDYVDPKGKRVGIFAVKLKPGRDIEKARSKQRNFIARLLADYNLDAALAAFYLNEETKWRLSFVRLDYEFLKGKVAKSITPAKRYSYLVGKDEPCHTAQESLLPIFEAENFRPTIDSIEQAFSIEKVTKQFFEKYKEKYLQLKEYLENTPCFVEEANIRKFTTEQFAKKLMGQIVFMYFLQKKGWLGVKAIKQTITASEYKKLFWYSAKTREFAPRLYTQINDNTYKLNQAVLTSLSDEEEKLIAMAIKGEPWGTGSRTFMRDLFNFAMKKNANFFDDFLEPLFYEGMNRQRDADNYFPHLHCRIPFLNGGLFEELGHYDWRNNAFRIPNEMFSNIAEKGAREADGILDIFDRYNFTMNEDEPLEKEVAVDPEMLGKIFENLLDVTDRKSKGAFYTPREIVHYMCQESLTNYLVNTVGTPYEDTKDFVLYGEIMKDEDCSREAIYGFSVMQLPDSIYKNLKAIDDALADVRIADPAVGSGAFPMGMLSEIVKLRNIITEYMARDLIKKPEFANWKHDQKVFSMVNIERWKLRNYQRNAYKLKQETIRNSIYAVDIEPSAVDIAKLRLWLTLVVEQEIDPNDSENDSPLTLPNLDCNIMCGNSLIDEFEGIDLSFDSVLFGNNGQGTIWGGGIDTDLERLFVAEHDYFYANTRDKKIKYADAISEIKGRLINLAFTSADTQKRERFNEALSSASTPFFLWKLNFAKVFKDKGGFDIVIGNPPYVDSETMTRNMKEARENYTKLYKVAKGNWDLFLLFIELGIKLLKTNGINSFILPNKLIAANYAKATRKLMSEYDIKGIRDYSDVKVFDAAAVYPIVYILIKSHELNFSVIEKMQSVEECLYKRTIEQTLFRKSASWDQFLVNDENITKILSKMDSNVPLSEFATVKGAATVDEAYTIKDNLSEQEYNEEKNFKFINTGTIDQYKTTWATDKTTYIKGTYIRPTFDKHILKTQLPTRYEESCKEKIIVGGMCKVLECYYDKGMCLAGKSTVIIFDSSMPLACLLSILNSKLMSFYYQNHFSSLSLAGGFYRFGTPQIKLLPIPNLPEDVIKQLVKLAFEVIEQMSGNNACNKQIDEIDHIIYSLYGLTPEEIALVENTVK